jgi:hypothetical protein
MRTIALLYLLPLLGLFSCCQRKPVIHNIYVDITQNGKDTIVLTDYTDFNWDRALLFHQTISSINRHSDSIEAAFSINLKDIPSHYENSAPFIFLKDNKIIYMEKNFEDTFPNDEDILKEEKIVIKTQQFQHVIEIRKEKCQFKAKRNYNKISPKNHIVALKHIP